MYLAIGKKLFLILICMIIPHTCAYAPRGDDESKISPGLSLKISEYDVSDRVPVIVVLNRGDSALDVNGTGYVKKRYELINAVSASLTRDEIKRLENNPDVEKVYYDGISYPLPMEDSPKRLMASNTDAIGATYANNVLNYTGRNVTIAIIDTGIDYNHSDLGGCIGPACKVRGGYDFANSDSDPMDDNGHGTHCAGIAAANGAIKGVAPDARLLAARVCNDGGCRDSDAMAAIDWAVANGADVISLSLGTNKQPSKGSDPIQMLCDAASRIGVTVVAAVGNEGPGSGTIADISASDTVIGVGADDDGGTASASDDVVPDFSCRGPAAYGRFKPEVIAPGTSIYSTGLGGGYLTKQGTSMAAPHVAGAAALLLEYNRSLNPAQVKSALMNSAGEIAGHPYETGAGLINVSRAISSQMRAEINGKPAWEASVPRGMNETASLRIKNHRERAVNISLIASALSDNDGRTLDPSALVFPSDVGLGPMEEKTVSVSFIGENASYGTYAAVLDLFSADDRVRIPVSITVPLRGEGTITGSVNDYCSEQNQEGCGMSPTGYINQWGDWKYYLLENQNGSVMQINLSWDGKDTDLDLYLFGPDGGLYNVSGEGNTESEYITLSNLVYPEYWAAVYAFDIAPERIDYELKVSYSSSIRMEPVSYQLTAAKGADLVLNYTIVNDGSSDTDLAVDSVAQKNLAGQTRTGSIAYTGSGYYDFIWKKSTSGLDLEGVQYMNASLTWNNPSKDLNMYMFYKNGNDWNTSDYVSAHRNDLLGTGIEEIHNADIKYYLEYSDIGIGLSNPESAQAYTLTLNFSGEGTCSYATADTTLISSLPASEQRALQVTVDTSVLTAGSTYDFDVVIKKNGANIARSPVRIAVTDMAQSTSTTTTTTTSTTSTTTSQVTTSTTTSTTHATSTTTTTNGSTTTTTEASCSLAGDFEPCGEVSLSEVVSYINEWSHGTAYLGDVVALINAWAAS